MPPPVSVRSMLELRLRTEFQGRRLKGTAIELANASNTGATQVAAADFLEITYPSADALAAIEAVGSGRPLVLIGERGQGKSHLMGLLYHGFANPGATRHWLATWAIVSATRRWPRWRCETGCTSSARASSARTIGSVEPLAEL